LHALYINLKTQQNASRNLENSARNLSASDLQNRATKLVVDIPIRGSGDITVVSYIPFHIHSDIELEPEDRDKDHISSETEAEI
jgi:hypothetical protein